MLKPAVLLILVAVAINAIPLPTTSHKSPSNANKEQESRIVKNYSEENPDGSYRWGYETSNGIKQEQESHIKVVNNMEIRVVTGRYSYRQDDGTTVTVTYISDENGYQPTITYS